MHLNRLFLKSKGVLILVLMIIFFGGCSSSNEIQTMEEKYDAAIQYMDKGSFGQATPLFQSIIDQNPGTRYAAYSYLKLADAHILAEDSGKYDEAETNYRIFLNFNSYSHLVPYVLSKLMELNYKRNTSFFFGREYAFSRDPDHFKKIINEYQRFYFLYPNSLYLKDAETYLKDSIEALAEHELIVGDWYFDHSLFEQAIFRYRYIMREYPNFGGWQRVIEKLIVAYRNNQQPHLADEFQRVYEQKKSDMASGLN
jgi:outer membrane protein assembly factor BamD